MVNYYYDDIDYTDHKLQIFTLYEMNINKDGTMYLFTSSYMPQTSTIHTVEIHGTWEFSEDKRHFYFTEQYTNDNTQPQPLLGGVRHDYFILKLFEKDKESEVKNLVNHNFIKIGEPKFFDRLMEKFIDIIVA